MTDSKNKLQFRRCLFCLYYLGYSNNSNNSNSSGSISTSDKWEAERRVAVTTRLRSLSQGNISALYEAMATAGDMDDMLGDSSLVGSSTEDDTDRGKWTKNEAIARRKRMLERKGGER